MPAFPHRRAQYLEGFCPQRGWILGRLVSIDIRHEIDALNPDEIVPQQHIYSRQIIRATLATDFGTGIFEKFRGSLRHEDGSITDFPERSDPLLVPVQWIAPPRRARRPDHPGSVIYPGNVTTHRLHDVFTELMRHFTRGITQLGGADNAITLDSSVSGFLSAFLIPTRDIADFMYDPEVEQRLMSHWTRLLQETVRLCAAGMPSLVSTQGIWCDPLDIHHRQFHLVSELQTRENPRDRTLEVSVFMRLESLHFQGNTNPYLGLMDVPEALWNHANAPQHHFHYAVPPQENAPEEEIEDLGSFMDSLKAGIDGAEELPKAKFNREGGFSEN